MASLLLTKYGEDELSSVVAGHPWRKWWIFSSVERLKADALSVNSLKYKASSTSIGRLCESRLIDEDNAPRSSGCEPASPSFVAASPATFHRDGNSLPIKEHDDVLGNIAQSHAHCLLVAISSSFGRRSVRRKVWYKPL